MTLTYKPRQLYHKPATSAEANCELSAALSLLFDLPVQLDRHNDRYDISNTTTTRSVAPSSQLNRSLPVSLSATLAGHSGTGTAGFFAGACTLW